MKSDVFLVNLGFTQVFLNVNNILKALGVLSFLLSTWVSQYILPLPSLTNTALILNFIGITRPNHGIRRILPWFEVKTMVKFCVYHGLGGGYSYFNMTNYFKMNNYCKFYCKTLIVRTAIMSDNRE